MLILALCYLIGAIILAGMLVEDWVRERRKS